MRTSTTVVTCRFTASEMELIDEFIELGYFRNRSEAVRMLVWKTLETWSPNRIKARGQRRGDLYDQ